MCCLLVIIYRKFHQLLYIENSISHYIQKIECLRLYIRTCMLPSCVTRAGLADNAMGWLRLVGPIKLQVSFAEYHLFYRAFLQKRPIILRSLLHVATPHIYCCTNKHTNVYTHKCILVLMGTVLQVLQHCTGFARLV